MLEVNQSNYKTPSEGTSAEMEEALLLVSPGHYVSWCLKYKRFGLIYVLAWAVYLFHWMQ